MKTIVIKATKAWQSFWFTPTDAASLGFLRAAFFGGMFVCYRLFRALPGPWAEVDTAFWQPSGIAAWLDLPPANAVTLNQLYFAWLLTLFTSCLGLFSRASMWAAFVLGTYVLGMPYNYGWHSHFNIVVVFAMFIFASSRAADAWSLDNAFLAWQRQPRGAGAVSLQTLLLSDRADSADYAWPVRALWVAITFQYFSAGITKLLHGAWAWVMSDTMAIHLTDNAFANPGFAPSSRLGLLLALTPWAAKLMAALGLVFELLFPLALFSSRLRAPLVISAIGFNVSAYVLMGPQFYELIFCNAVLWVPWREVGARVLAVRQPAVLPSTHEIRL